jgi:hypothetical protein
MSTVNKGLVFAAIAVGVDLVSGLVVLRPLLGLSWSATSAVTAILVLFGAVFGFFMGWKDIYEIGPRSIWAFVLDVSWSAINTVTGLVWLIWCAAKGSLGVRDDETRKRGVVNFAGANVPLGGADATTLGTIIGGKWMLHEAVHVQQARIFGPLYWPVYLVSYLTNMLVRFLTGRFSGAHAEAYARVVMEDWAYRSAPLEPPGPHAEVNVLKSFIWFMVTLVLTAAVVVLVPPVARAIGLTLIPWWMGLMVILVYALGRSYLPGANEAPAQVVFT